MNVADALTGVIVGGFCFSAGALAAWRYRPRGDGATSTAPLDSTIVAPGTLSWGTRQPIEARCGCRVDFLELDCDEYAMVLSECAAGARCPVVRYVFWEIDRTRQEVAAL